MTSASNSASSARRPERRLDFWTRCCPWVVMLDRAQQFSCVFLVHNERGASVV